MPKWPVHARIDGPIVMIGFGSIGKGTLPLIERHFHYDKKRFVVIDPEDKDRKLLDSRGIRFIHQAVTKDNYRHLLTPLLTAGGGQGFCVNVSVDTSSLDIMELCREIGALYIDTVVEPWKGFYFDTKLGPEARSNYALREIDSRRARATAGRRPPPCQLLRRQSRHGVVVRQAGAAQHRRATLGLKFNEPKIARRMGAAGAERPASRASTLPSATRSAPSSPSRWTCSSTPGRWRASLSEGLQPAELGWGTHEKWMPANVARAQIRLRRGDLSAAARRQYARALLDADGAGRSYGFLVTHNESISIADYFTLRAGPQERSIGRPATTPTTRADDAVLSLHEMFGRAGKPHRRTCTFSTSTRSSTASTSSACCSTATSKNAYWYGSQLSIEETREARAVPERHRPAGDLGGARAAWSGRWKIRTPASSKPTRWISAAVSRCRSPISGR